MPDIFDSTQMEEDNALESSKDVLQGIRKKRVHRRHGYTPRDQEHMNDHKHRHVDEYSEVMRHERPHGNPLRSFLPKPETISFDSQSSGEDIILVLRKHPVTQVKWISIAIFMGLLPFFLSALFPSETPFLVIPPSFQFASILLWYLLLTGYVLESFLSWFFNVYIITDERIIDVDFLSLIYRNVSSAKIDNIEDVTAQTGGAVQAMFNFGTVRIQTAAANAEFEFDEVPQPNKVTKLINELILEEEREKVEGRVQ